MSFKGTPGSSREPDASGATRKHSHPTPRVLPSTRTVNLFVDTASAQLGSKLAATFRTGILVQDKEFAKAPVYIRAWICRRVEKAEEPGYQRFQCAECRLAEGGQRSTRRAKHTTRRHTPRSNIQATCRNLIGNGVYLSVLKHFLTELQVSHMQKT